VGVRVTVKFNTQAVGCQGEGHRRQSADENGKDEISIVSTKIRDPGSRSAIFYSRSFETVVSVAMRMRDLEFWSSCVFSQASVRVPNTGNGPRSIVFRLSLVDDDVRSSYLSLYLSLSRCFFSFLSFLSLFEPISYSPALDVGAEM
jgi:hypothetical protein